MKWNKGGSQLIDLFFAKVESAYSNDFKLTIMQSNQSPQNKFSTA